MIITKSPLRIGFFGGGSDMPSYFMEHQGRCVNATIDKYVYVLVKKRFDDKIYLKYSQNEVWDINHIDSIEHDFIRETLKYLEIDYGLEIINWADIPTRGTGLGSSSSFLVGLLLALHTLEGNRPSKEELAEQACHIEIELCKKPIGFQDQYAAAFGGINCFHFFNNKQVGSPQVYREEYIIPNSELLTLSNNMMMYYTGRVRDSGHILKDQNDNLKGLDKEAVEAMKENVQLAEQAGRYLPALMFNEFGVALSENWYLKKKFAKGITDPFIDSAYDMFLNSGAIGGKITGAGGGGFFVLYVPEDKKNKVRDSVNHFNEKLKEFSLREMPFKFDKYGSRVLIDVEEHKW